MAGCRVEHPINDDPSARFPLARVPAQPARWDTAAPQRPGDLSCDGYEGIGIVGEHYLLA